MMYKKKTKKTHNSSTTIQYQFNSLAGYYYCSKAGAVINISEHDNKLYAKLMDHEFELKNTFDNRFIFVMDLTSSLKFNKNKNSFNLLFQNPGEAHHIA